MATKKELSKEEVKEAIKKKCLSMGVGEKPMTFVLCGKRNNHSFRPKCKYIDKDTNYGFNLRYTPLADDPFEDDQDLGDVVELKRIDWPGDRWTVYPSDPCLQMYLLLHPYYGKDKVFYMEDRVADANELTNYYKKMTMVVDLCNTADQEVLESAYYMLHDNTRERNVSILRSGILRKMEEVGPEAVLEVFGDKRSIAKFRLQTALERGIVKMNASATSLNWSTGGEILKCAKGVNIRNEFSEWAISSTDGQAVYEKLTKAINS